MYNSCLALLLDRENFLSQKRHDRLEDTFLLDRIVVEALCGGITGCRSGMEEVVDVLIDADDEDDVSKYVDWSDVCVCSVFCCM